MTEILKLFELQDWYDMAQMQVSTGGVHTQLYFQRSSGPAGFLQLVQQFSSGKISSVPRRMSANSSSNDRACVCICMPLSYT